MQGGNRIQLVIKTGEATVYLQATCRLCNLPVTSPTNIMGLNDGYSGIEEILVVCDLHKDQLLVHPDNFLAPA